MFDICFLAVRFIYTRYILWHYAGYLSGLGSTASPTTFPTGIYMSSRDLYKGRLYYYKTLLLNTFFVRPISIFLNVRDLCAWWIILNIKPCKFLFPNHIGVYPMKNDRKTRKNLRKVICNSWVMDGFRRVFDHLFPFYECSTFPDNRYSKDISITNKHVCVWFSVFQKRILEANFPLCACVQNSPASDNIQCGTVVTRSIFSQILTRDTHCSPVRTRYGVSFVDPISDWYSTTVPVIIYIISYKFGSRYIGNQLYFP